MATWFIPASPIAFRLRNLAMRHMPRRLLARYFLNSVKSDILAASGLASEGHANGKPAGSVQRGCPYVRD